MRTILKILTFQLDLNSSDVYFHFGFTIIQTWVDTLAIDKSILTNHNARPLTMFKKCTNRHQ